MKKNSPRISYEMDTVVVREWTPDEMRDLQEKYPHGRYNWSSDGLTEARIRSLTMETPTRSITITAHEDGVHLKEVHARRDPDEGDLMTARTWPETTEERNRFADWQYEVANADTVLGFRDWVDHHPVNDHPPKTRITIDGTSRLIDTVTQENENGVAVETLSFDQLVEVLNAWQQHDHAGRTFDWTSDADDSTPSPPYVVWIDDSVPGGTLRKTHVHPFFDGLTVTNTYALDELSDITGITTQDR